MPRRKVTFVYDPGKAPKWLLDIPRAVGDWPEAWTGVDPSSVTVEDLPDPPVHQRFIAEYFGWPGMPPLEASQVRARLRENKYQDGTWTVTEVPDA